MGDEGTVAEDSARETPLQFFPLTFQPDGDDVAVGRLDTGSFIVLAAEDAELVRRLADGMPEADAEQWYRVTHGQEVDVADLVNSLVELEFVRPAGAGSMPTAPATETVRWQRLGRAVFSLPTAILTAVLVVVACVVVVRNPDLAPTYPHLFFTPYLSVLMLVMFVGQLPLILLHEAAHALAGRRLGLPTTLSVGRRFYFVVFLTTMDGLVGVPRRKRFLPLLAGVLADVTVLAGLIVVAELVRASDGELSPIGAALVALGYLTVLRIVWQAWFFLRTDIYYLIATVLGCVDLHTVTLQLLSNLFSRLTGQVPRYDPETWHPRDRAVARWYGVLVVAGYGLLTVTLVFSIIPATVHAFGLGVGRLIGGSHSPLEVVDSVVFLVLSAGELLVAAGMYLRERLRARRGGLLSTAPAVAARS